MSGFGDVRVRPASLSHMDDGRARAQSLRADPRVREAIIALTFPGALGKRGRFRGAPVFGVDMARADLPFQLIKGLLLSGGDEEGIIVGSSLANRLDIEPGDKLQLRVIFSSGQEELAEEEEEVGRYTMVVRGLASGTFGASHAVFLDYGFLAREAGLQGAASLVILYLFDHDLAAPMAREISAGSSDIEASDWMEDDAFIRSAIQSSDAIGMVSEAMVVFAVAIPVLALLFIHVLHRRRDIGLLAAIGFSPGDIFAVFLLQAIIIGLAGIALGCGLGYAIILYFEANPIFEWQGFVIEPVVSLGSFVRPASVVFAITVGAGVYPALRAARVDPARVLRGAE